MSDAKDHKSPVKGKKINQQRVLPIPLQQSGAGAASQQQKVKGADLFALPHANALLVGPTGAGKTSVIFHIIKKRCTPQTTIYLFCSTAYIDEGWISIRKWCEENDQPIEVFTELGDNLETLIAEASAEKEDSSDEEVTYAKQMTEHGVVLVPVPAQRKKKKLPKYVEVERLVIFDDLGHELRSKTVAQWCKTARHFKAFTVTSSQMITDFLPGTRRQQRYFLLFGRMDPKNLKLVHDSVGLPFSTEVLKEMYDEATAEKYGFLYIDVPKMQFRSGFDTLLEAPK